MTSKYDFIFLIFFCMKLIKCLKIRFEKMDYQASIKSKVGWSMNGAFKSGCWGGWKLLSRVYKGNQIIKIYLNFNPKLFENGNFFFFKKLGLVGIWNFWTYNDWNGHFWNLGFVENLNLDLKWLENGFLFFFHLGFVGNLNFWT